MKKYLFIIFLLIPQLCFGAVSASTVWEVRPTATSTTAGCGFVTGASGTDRSQQDSPQITYTDLVIGVTTTELTSAAFPFTASEVGNIIRITSGTGFTVGYYQVVSVAGSTATMDRSVGTGGSTGGNGNLGGACAGLDQVVDVPSTSDFVAGNKVYVKKGTYVESVALTTAIDGGNGTPIRVIGYNATRDDEPTGANMPLFSGNNRLATGFTITDLDGWVLENLSFRSYTADGILGNDGSSGSMRLININSSHNGDDGVDAHRGMAIFYSEFCCNTDDGVSQTNNNGMTVYKSWLHNNSDEGGDFGGNASVVNSLITNNLGNGLVWTSTASGASAQHNTIYGNGDSSEDGISIQIASSASTSTFNLIDNTSVSNNRFAYNATGGSDVTNFLDYSNYNGHATELNNILEGQFNTGDTSPGFVNASGGDWSLATGSALVDTGSSPFNNAWTYTGGDFKWNIGNAQNDPVSAGGASNPMILIGVTAQ